MTGPDPNSTYPNENIRQVVYIKNVISRPNILVGDYTYYDDIDGAEKFEEHVTHHYDFLGDRLIIGKFCAIARGIEFIMNGANHRMNSVTTYPFNIMGGGWEKFAPKLDDLPLKGDTVVGNDVWIGQNVTVLPFKLDCFAQKFVSSYYHINRTVSKALQYLFLLFCRHKA